MPDLRPVDQSKLDMLVISAGVKGRKNTLRELQTLTKSQGKRLVARSNDKTSFKTRTAIDIPRTASEGFEHLTYTFLQIHSGIPRFPLDAYYNHVRDPNLPAPHRGIFSPTPPEDVHCGKVAHAALWDSVRKHIPRVAGCLPEGCWLPPKLSQTPIEEPDVVSYQPLHTKSCWPPDWEDTAPGHFGKVHENMPKQEGKEQEEWAQELVVLFGDRGNARPVERLREDRWPSQPGIFESLDNILVIPGGNHMISTMLAGVLKHYAGPTDDLSPGDVPGMLQFNKILKGPDLELGQVKNLDAMLRLAIAMAEVSLLDILLKITGRDTIDDITEADISGDNFARVEKVFHKDYAAAIDRARDGDPKAKPDPDFHTSLARLRDLIMIRESHLASSRGDIEALIIQYKNYVPFSQGVAGMKKHKRIIANLLLKLNGPDLPPDLQHAIKMSFLINPSGQPGHFVPQDYLARDIDTYRETQHITDPGEPMKEYTVGDKPLRELLSALKVSQAHVSVQNRTNGCKDVIKDPVEDGDNAIDEAYVSEEFKQFRKMAECNEIDDGDEDIDLDEL